MYRVYFEGVFLRILEFRIIYRRGYNVYFFRVLYYIDGNYKLIWWWFVIYGMIDGYFRMIIFVRCLVDNKVLIVVLYFMEGI